MPKQIQKILFPYALVVLFAYIGFSLPLPILPKMFLDSQTSIAPPSFLLIPQCPVNEKNGAFLHTHNIRVVEKKRQNVIH